MRKSCGEEPDDGTEERADQQRRPEYLPHIHRLDVRAHGGTSFEQRPINHSDQPMRVPTVTYGEECAGTRAKTTRRLAMVA